MKRILFGMLALAFLGGCIELENYPDTPEINHKGYEISLQKDMLGNNVYHATLTLKVVDGDGNIGLGEEDTTGYFHKDSIYYNNLFIRLFEKRDGQFKEKILSVPHNYRTPNIEIKGQNKTLVADIKVTMDYSPIGILADTLMYEYYLYDHDLNKSNTVQTPIIIVSELLKINTNGN